jgi:hypothetical protein
MAKIETLKDHRGFEVPVDKVKKTDLKKHKLALKILKKAEKISSELNLLKSESYTEIDNLYDLEAKENGIVGKGKGGFTFYSYDKEVKVEVGVADRIEFDEHIQFAQEKINDFLSEKTKGIDTDLSQLINNAFQTTRGKLDTKRIISLFKLNIENEQWKQAMDLIKKSMSSNSSKRYMNVYKKDKEGQYTNVQLNFSAI